MQKRHPIIPSPAKLRVLSRAQKIALCGQIGISRARLKPLLALKNPAQIQSFINRIPINFEVGGVTCMGVHQTLLAGRAHCIEGAFVAALALWLNGYPPLLLDLKAAGDDDHVVALFAQNGAWGAISKSNHPILRWRDPIYKSVRELALSYFHEYTKNGRKTLRSHSRPFNLLSYDIQKWLMGDDDGGWDVALALDTSRHDCLITPAQARTLRVREGIERKLDSILEYPRPSLRKK